jgi:hypothetical protein
MQHALEADRAEHYRPLLLLDEPTDGVDMATEDALLTALPAVTAGRITILISHRAEVLARCHRAIDLPAAARPALRAAAGSPRPAPQEGGRVAMLAEAAAHPATPRLRRVAEPGVACGGACVRPAPSVDGSPSPHCSAPEPSAAGWRSPRPPPGPPLWANSAPTPARLPPPKSNSSLACAIISTPRPIRQTRSARSRPARPRTR